MSANLVVGYDGSPAARKALRYATAHVDGGTLHVVASVVPPPEWMGAPGWEEILEEENRRGRELLADAADQVPPAVECVTELVEGPAAEAIVNAAEACGADEIVVGSRGLGRVRAVLGSVSHDVLHLADRPVVVIPAAASLNGGEDRS